MYAKFELPWPPSANHLYATFRGRRILSAKGRQFQNAVAALVKLAGHKAPMTGRLRVSRFYYPPDKRRRDISNLTKAVDDALTFAGVWDDDCQIDEGREYRCAVVPKGRCLVEIEAI
jgi:crossover junction endodeoxyribonuclease RusA